MAERTLAEQHGVEREYYLGKTNKLPNGKLVTTAQKEYGEAKVATGKKLEKLQERFRKKRKGGAPEATKPETISTVVTIGLIDKVKQEPFEPEKPLQTDTKSGNEPVKVEAQAPAQEKSSDK